MTKREIQIAVTSDWQMTISLAEPEEGSKELVILCHGFMSRKGSQTNSDLRKMLLPNQIASLRFDFYGHGNDGHPFQEITLSHCLHQLEAVLSWAKNHYSRIALLGSSFGGLVAIHAAARHSEVTTLGLKCPVSDYPPLWQNRLGAGGMAHWRESGCLSFMTAEDRRARLDYRFFEDLLNYDTYKEAANIRASVLTIHGSADEDVPCAQSRHLQKVLQSENELVVLKGADHTFSNPDDFDQMLRLLLEWFVRHKYSASP